MPLDFPTSPSTNDIYTFGTSSWKWTGDSWTVYSTPLVGNTGSTGNTGATGPVGDYVITFNGRTGNIQGVTSINGATGTIINVAFTNLGNTFTVRQVMNAGITSSSISVAGSIANFNPFNSGQNSFGGSLTTLGSTDTTVQNAAALLTLSPTTVGAANGTLRLLGFDGDVSLYNNDIKPQAIQTGNLDHTLPATTGTLLNDKLQYVATFNGRTGTIQGVTSINGATGTIINVAFTNLGNTFTVRQVFNAGITASGGMTLFGSLNSYSGISASGITSDSGYRITAGAINAQTTSYTMLASDSGKIITMDPSSTGITLTVPTGLPIGHTTTIIRLSSTLNVGISAASGVTINSFQNQKNIAGQHAAVSLISYTTDTFNLAGGLTG